MSKRPKRHAIESAAPIDAAPVALPTSLSDEDHRYLQALIGKAQTAQANADCPVCGSQRALRGFMDYLSSSPRYQLSQGDQIAPDGAIVRKDA